VIAEQFGTLASLYPGRIDLGLGRAPGSDQLTVRALRRSPLAAETFPDDVIELMRYFEPARPGQLVQAVPGAGLDVPIWILGSSLYGAQLAAELGLPYAFASHFAPAALYQALEHYRSRFKPSDRLDRPHVMLGVNVFAADTDADGRRLFTSLQQAFVNLRRGHPGRLPPPDEGFLDRLQPGDRQMVDEVLSVSAVGSPETVSQKLEEIVDRTGADELMLTSQIYDHGARLRSFELTAGAPAGAAPSGR
jgi:luciferase family oxidoreductase group 1